MIAYRWTARGKVCDICQRPTPRSERFDAALLDETGLVCGDRILLGGERLL